MKHALAAGSAKEASAASKARELLAVSSTVTASAATQTWLRRTRRVERNQCCSLGLQCVRHSAVWITTMMRDANRASEVKYKDFVEQCVRHLEEKEMCQVPGHAGRLFLHETLWDRWSRGLSFAMKMSEGPDVRDAE